MGMSVSSGAEEKVGWEVNSVLSWLVSLAWGPLI